MQTTYEQARLSTSRFGSRHIDSAARVLHKCRTTSRIKNEVGEYPVDRVGLTYNPDSEVLSWFPCRQLTLDYYRQSAKHYKRDKAAKAIEDHLPDELKPKRGKVTELTAKGKRTHWKLMAIVAHTAMALEDCMWFRVYEPIRDRDIAIPERTKERLDKLIDWLDKYLAKGIKTYIDVTQERTTAGNWHAHIFIWFSKSPTSTEASRKKRIKAKWMELCECWNEKFSRYGCQFFKIEDHDRLKNVLNYATAEKVNLPLGEGYGKPSRQRHYDCLPTKENKESVDGAVGMAVIRDVCEMTSYKLTHFGPQDRVVPRDRMAELAAKYGLQNLIEPAKDVEPVDLVRGKVVIHVVEGGKFQIAETIDIRIRPTPPPPPPTRKYGTRGRRGMTWITATDEDGRIIRTPSTIGESNRHHFEDPEPVWH